MIFSLNVVELNYDFFIEIMLVHIETAVKRSEAFGTDYKQKFKLYLKYSFNEFWFSTTYDFCDYGEVAMQTSFIS